METAMRTLNNMNKVRPFLRNIVKQNKEKMNKTQTLIYTLYRADDSALPTSRVARHMLNHYT